MNRKRIRVRRERDGAIVYDPKSRNYAFLEGNLFDGEVFLQRVNLHVAKVLGLSPEQVLSIEFVGNGRSALAELSAPIGVYFEITPKCNLQCKHCYKCGLPDKPALSYSEIVRVIDELVGLGLLEFRLCGNEPIIHPDFDKVALHAKSKGLYVSTNTNGFYGDRLIEKLLVVQFDEVIVSLDGLEETHDWIRAPSSFKRAVHVLEELHAAGTKSRINMTVSKFNIDEVEAVGDLAVQLGAYVSYIPIRVVGRDTEFKNQFGLSAEEMKTIVEVVMRLRDKHPATRFLTYFDILAEQPDYYHPMWLNTPCPARKNIYISFFGDAYPCDFLFYLGDIFSAGNVRENSMMEIWCHSEGLERFRNLKRAPRCCTCEMLGVKCYGGCPSESLAEELVVDDPLCFRHLLTG